MKTIIILVLAVLAMVYVPMWYNQELAQVAEFGANGAPRYRSLNGLEAACYHSGATPECIRLGVDYGERVNIDAAVYHEH